VWLNVGDGEKPLKTVPGTASIGVGSAR